MKNSKNIFIWGKNPAYTTIHTMQILQNAKLNGCKVIVIDPIKTSTANIADYYIQINPGTDGALAMAMAKIIIKENLCDKDYRDSYVLGYEEYKNYLDTLELDYLSRECGIELDTIKELAKLYVQKYSSIWLGYGIQKYRNGGNTIRAIDALGAITGQIGYPGGGINYANKQKYSSIWLGYGIQKYRNGGNTIRAIDALGAITGQIGYPGGGINYANKVYPAILNTDPYCSYTYAQNREFYVHKLSEFIDNSIKCTVNNGDNAVLKMAVIVKSNLLNQLPNLNKLESSFDKIEFKVCFDMFMTDTASQCDLFIPCSTTLESEDLLYSSMCNPYITYNEKAVEPMNKLMDEYYFFRELAKVMKINNYPQVSKKEYLNKVIEPLKTVDKSINLDKIKNEYITIHKSIPWEDKKFETTSGKFELYSSKVKSLGITPIPTYIEPEKIREGEFRLITTHHRETLFSQHYMDKKGISKAYINEKMAIIRKIANNDIVSLQSENGKINVQIVIDNNVKDNIVQMHVGWWKKHGNPNFITSSNVSDLGGQVTYNETFVDIIKQNVKDNIVQMHVGWWKKHGNPNFITSSNVSDLGGQVTYNETFVDIIKQN